MDQPETEGKQATLKTSSDKTKSLDQFEQLRRDGKADEAVVVVRNMDGSIDILGQGLPLGAIVMTLVQAVQTAEAALEAHGRKPSLEPHEEPTKRGVLSGGKPRTREVRIDAAGNLVPPAGESLVSCGQCAHPRWYITLHDADESPARFICASCGNEVKIRSFPAHFVGHA